MFGRLDKGSSSCGLGAVSAAADVGPRNRDPPDSKHAVKPCAVETQVPVTRMSRAFYGIAQLIIVPISDIMSTWRCGF